MVGSMTYRDAQAFLHVVESRVNLALQIVHLALQEVPLQRSTPLCYALSVS